MKPTDKLKQLYLEYSRVRYPSVPEYARVTPVYIGKHKTTNGLTNCVILWIKLKGWQAERVNNTGRRIDNTKVVTDVIGRKKQIGSVQWIKGTGTKGTADISATIQGRSIKIEIKNKYTKDTQSEAQKAYQQYIEKTGGIYYVCTDLESFSEWVEQFPDNELCKKHEIII